LEHALFDEIITVEKVNSTQSLAEKLIREQDMQGNFLVVAAEQFCGRGRGENRWVAPRGGLWMTMALYGLEVPSSLTLYTGLCMRRALAELGAPAMLKWPNDIMLQDRKLCGILTTHLAQRRYHLAGIGVNTNVPPEDLPDTAICLQQALGREGDNEALALRFFDHFAAGLPDFIACGFEPLVEEYTVHCWLRGKRLSLRSEFDEHEGVARGVNRQGALLLELQGGMIQPFYAGAVEHVRPRQEK